MQHNEHRVRELAAAAQSRHGFWASLIAAEQCRVVAEVGVYRGAFAARLLDACPSISRYYMIDPWRHLDDWNKPANRSDERFEDIHAEVLDTTAAHADRRVVLRGRTVDVVDEISDGDLDLAYIDGDHTLRGITIDLHRIYPKVREGGWIGGDDFCRSIFQHAREFEPTLVFPYAVYFAEAVGTRIYGLPRKQFLIEKVAGGRYEFIDLTGSYDALTLNAQFDALDPAEPPEPQVPPESARDTAVQAGATSGSLLAATAREMLGRLTRRWR